MKLMVRRFYSLVPRIMMIKKLIFRCVLSELTLWRQFRHWKALTTTTPLQRTVSRQRSKLTILQISELFSPALCKLSMNISLLHWLLIPLLPWYHIAPSWYAPPIICSALVTSVVNVIAPRSSYRSSAALLQIIMLPRRARLVTLHT